MKRELQDRVDIIQFDEPAFNVFEEVNDWETTLERAMEGLDAQTNAYLLRLWYKSEY
jgi:hypothetical protein